MPKIFIESLPKKCTAEMLKTYLLQFVTEVTVKRSKNKGRRIKMYAIVEFSKEEDYQKIVNGDYYILGEKLNVKPFINFKKKNKKVTASKLEKDDEKSKDHPGKKSTGSKEKNITGTGATPHQPGLGGSLADRRITQIHQQWDHVKGNLDIGIGRKFEIGEVDTPEKKIKFELKNLKLFCESLKKNSQIKGFNVNQKNPGSGESGEGSKNKFDLFGKLNISKKLSFSHSYDDHNLNHRVKDTRPRPSSQEMLDPKAWPELENSVPFDPKQDSRDNHQPTRPARLRLLDIIQPQSHDFEYISDYEDSTLNLGIHLVLKSSKNLHLWRHNSQNLRFNMNKNNAERGET